jgi:flagellar basal body-associated protein FliL
MSQVVVKPLWTGTEKKKAGLVKFLLIVISIAVSLFLVGFFESESVPQPKPEQGAVAVDVNVSKTSASQGLDQLYNLLPTKFNVNLVGNKKILQFALGFMTPYDQRVVDNVYKHEIVLRAAIIMQVSSYSKDQLDTATDKQRLADLLKSRINQVLIEAEGVGGVEEVFFTEFVIQ